MNTGNQVGMKKEIWHGLASMLPVFILILVVGVFFFATIRRSPPPTEKQLYGSLFVSDAGQSHGGFEYTASWNATLVVVESSGILNLTLNVGLGDVLNQHEFAISGFQQNDANRNISFRIGEIQLVLTNQTRDQVWNGTFDNYYIASWGGSAPPNEIIGTISPKIFPGLVDTCYIELRLR